MGRLLLILFAIASLVPRAQARVTIEIRSCGTVVDRSQVGMLVADLDCGDDRWGTCYVCPGGSNCTEIVPAVACSGRSDCPDPTMDKCDGGGSAPSVGVYLLPGARLYLNGHSIRHASIGVAGTYPDGTAPGTARARVIGPGTITNTREAIYVDNLQLSGGLTLGDSLYGVTASKVRATDVDASDNVIGVSAFESMRAKRVTADDNLYAGFLAYEHAHISYSHATGNTVADITSELLPRVARTVCDHSAALEDTGVPGVYEASGPPFGFCSGD
jgi:hypothetical protein